MTGQVVVVQGGLGRGDLDRSLAEGIVDVAGGFLAVVEDPVEAVLLVVVVAFALAVIDEVAGAVAL